MDLKNIVFEGVDYVHPAQDRDQWCSCEHGNKFLGSIKAGKFLDQLSESVSQGLCSF
jgi:hypothetical protein